MSGLESTVFYQIRYYSIVRKKYIFLSYHIFFFSVVYKVVLYNKDRDFVLINLQYYLDICNVNIKIIYGIYIEPIVFFFYISFLDQY